MKELVQKLIFSISNLEVNMPRTRGSDGGPAKPNSTPKKAKKGELVSKSVKKSMDDFKDNQ